MGRHAGRRSRFGRKVLLGGAMAVVVVAGSTVALVANAAENEVYDQKQLLEACQQDTDLYGKADRCRFEAATYEPFVAADKPVSPEVVNCGVADATAEQRWTQSTSESNSIEVSASVEAGLSKIFSASVSTTFGHTWERTEGAEAAVTMTVPAKHVGRILRGAPMAKVTGRMVINFGSRRQGHFEWYAYPTLNVPAEDQPSLARIVVDTDPMSQTQLDACPKTPGSKLGVNVGPATETVIQESSGGAAAVSGSVDTSQQHAED
jgi:hypothetical protein